MRQRGTWSPVQHTSISNGAPTKWRRSIFGAVQAWFHVKRTKAKLRVTANQRIDVPGHETRPVTRSTSYPGRNALQLRACIARRRHASVCAAGRFHVQRQYVSTVLTDVRRQGEGQLVNTHACVSREARSVVVRWSSAMTFSDGHPRLPPAGRVVGTSPWRNSDSGTRSRRWQHERTAVNRTRVAGGLHGEAPEDQLESASMAGAERQGGEGWREEARSR